MDAVLVDENQPLLGHGSSQCENGQDAQKVVDFDPNGDPDNPQEWTAPFKWSIVALLALMAFTV